MDRYDDPLKSVIELRKLLADEPDNLNARSKLHQYEVLAAEHYYHQGVTEFEQERYSEALDLYNQALVAMPQNDKVLMAVALTRNRAEAETLYMEAGRLHNAGKSQLALLKLQQLLELVPGHNEARIMMASLEAADQGENAKEAQKVSVAFKKAKLKEITRFLGKSFAINIIFDEEVEDSETSLEMQNVGFEEAMRILLESNKLFKVKLNDTTILIADDSKSKREQYERLILKTYHLASIHAEEMSAILKDLLKINRITLNKLANTLMIRETDPVHNLIEKLIEINDQRPAELILDVEILEVNRNRALQLGFDYGSVISAEFPKIQLGSETEGAVTSIGAALAAGTVTLPNIAFRYFKQDVDAETLANPKIRVMSQKAAKIHIGDRVPLRASTIQNASGQTQTSYEYSDIGIRLDVTPQVHVDNTIEVQLNLEVSSLGQNLGTPDEPTYSIGTRNAQTFMLLRDGETAVIGGLIRDEERRNAVKVPGLGSIPVIGSLFRSNDDQSNKNDVLLTITPKIVRPWAITRTELQSFNSGTAERVHGERLVTPMGKTKQVVAMSEVNTTLLKTEANTNTPLQLVIAKTLFQSKKLEEVDVGINLAQAQPWQTMTFTLAYNKEVLRLKDFTGLNEAIKDIKKRHTDEGVEVTIELKPDRDIKNGDALIFAQFVGDQAGISPLILDVKTAASDKGVIPTRRSGVGRVVVHE